MKASQCSGNGELAICTVDDGSLAAFNVSGLTWHTDAAIKAGNASSHAPFITRPSRLAVAGAIEGAGATKSVVVRSMDLGGVAYQLQLEEGAIGPWLLSNANPEDSLMLVVQADGIVLGINVELQLCWAAITLCIQSDLHDCMPARYDSLLPVSSPAVSATAAYFLGVPQHVLPEAGASPTLHIVRVTVGDMVARLLPVHLGRLNGTALAADGSAPLLLPSEDAQDDAAGVNVLLVRMIGGLAAVRVQDDAQSASFELLWQVSLAQAAEAPEAESASSDTPSAGLVLDPRGGVWVPVGTRGTTLRRIATADGSTLDEIALSDLGLGAPLTRPLVVGAPVAGGLALLASFGTAAGGCAFGGIGLDDGKLWWRQDGLCAAGQAAVIGKSTLVFGTRSDGVVALGEKPN